MATTRYTMSVTLEFATVEDRDAAYTQAKTWATNQKSGGKVSAGNLTKSEFTRPDVSSEAV